MGVSVFVAAGDSGAAGCDNGAVEAIHGIGVNAFASTPNNVAVGGTDFSDTYSGHQRQLLEFQQHLGVWFGYFVRSGDPLERSCAGLLALNYLGYGPHMARQVYATMRCSVLSS